MNDVLLGAYFAFERPRGKPIRSLPDNQTHSVTAPGLPVGEESKQSLHHPRSELAALPMLYAGRGEGVTAFRRFLPYQQASVSFVNTGKLL
jgi:hypothetical protein